jgi:hypothetical protein
MFSLATLRRAVAGTEAHLPILASGAVAFAGQMTFARVVLAWPFLGQVLYAAGVELFGYGMARLAARVRREGDKGVVAMSSAWLFSLYAGVCNYWHNSPSWGPTPGAVSLGVASVAGLAAFFVHERYAVRRERRKLGVVAPAPYVAVTDGPSAPVVVEAPYTPAEVRTAAAVADAVAASYALNELRMMDNHAAQGHDHLPPSKAVAATVAAPSAPVAATSRVSDGPSRSELARCYLDEQRIAGRLHEVDGPEVMRETGLGQSRAREVLRQYRRAAA